MYGHCLRKVFLKIFKCCSFFYRYFFRFVDRCNIFCFNRRRYIIFFKFCCQRIISRYRKFVLCICRNRSFCIRWMIPSYKMIIFIRSCFYRYFRSFIHLKRFSCFCSDNLGFSAFFCIYENCILSGFDNLNLIAYIEFRHCYPSVIGRFRNKLESIYSLLIKTEYFLRLICRKLCVCDNFLHFSVFLCLNI